MRKKDPPQNSLSIIHAFLKIRDVPYRIPLSPTETDDCCQGKSERLLQAFRKAGYRARYRVCAFRWSNLPLPKDILMIAHDDECLHVYLEVKINGRWIIVDPTWDKKLGHVLPVNEWDGEHSTAVAVPATERLSPTRSSRCMKDSMSEDATFEDMARNGSFYKALNCWLAKQRVRCK